MNKKIKEMMKKETKKKYSKPVICLELVNIESQILVGSPTVGPGHTGTDVEPLKPDDGDTDLEDEGFGGAKRFSL